jgi:hypothetical protein
MTNLECTGIRSSLVIECRWLKPLLTLHFRKGRNRAGPSGIKGERWQEISLSGPYSFVTRHSTFVI